ncbi:bL21 family ribosomal protein [candidate division KSB1 bacterium]|nr:bL21 family ribosomal protein [candidate division KSB1 bacterium]
MYAIIRAGGKQTKVHEGDVISIERIKETGDIFYAQADRKWIQDGVAVRVSMVGFDDGSESRQVLDDEDVKSFQPGDIIWVPRKSDRKFWPVFLQVVTVTAQLAAIYLIIDTSINR